MAQLYSLHTADGVLNAQGMAKFLEKFDDLAAAGYRFTPDATDLAMWTSPAGVVYKNGSAEGHRLLHLLTDLLNRWPTEADGAGYSLVLIAPWKLPDHASAANWRLSASVDGSPGGYDGVRLADWKTQHNQTLNLDDPDMDSIPNLLEYPLSGDPSAPSPASLPTVSMQPFPGPADPPYLMLSVRLNRAADDVLVQPELSADGTTWSNEGISLVSANLDAGTGLTTWQWRSNTSWPARQRGFFRLRAMLR